MSSERLPQVMDPDAPVFSISVAAALAGKEAEIEEVVEDEPAYDWTGIIGGRERHAMLTGGKTSTGYPLYKIVDDPEPPQGETALEIVDGEEKEQPHHVDKVPIPRSSLKPEVLAGGEVTVVGTLQTDDQEDRADQDVEAVEAGRHVEHRAVRARRCKGRVAFGAHGRLGHRRLQR